MIIQEIRMIMGLSCKNCHTVNGTSFTVVGNRQFSKLLKFFCLHIKNVQYYYDKIVIFIISSRKVVWTLSNFLSFLNPFVYARSNKFQLIESYNIFSIIIITARVFSVINLHTSAVVGVTFWSGYTIKNGRCGTFSHSCYEKYRSKYYTLPMIGLLFASSGLRELMILVFPNFLTEHSKKTFQENILFCELQIQWKHWLLVRSVKKWKIFVHLDTVAMDWKMRAHAVYYAKWERDQIWSSMLFTNKNDY